jgi:hypothetical protein
MPYLVKTPGLGAGVSGENGPRKFVFWKIIFEVQLQEVENSDTGQKEVKPLPMIQKEVSIWQIFPEGSNQMPEQVQAKKVKELGGPAESVNVTYVYDDDLKRYKAVFNDGYLKFTDSDLKGDIFDLFQENLELEGLSVQNDLGFNIGIWVDCNFSDAPANGDHPIFYYQQPGKDPIVFSEKANGNNGHKINWSVRDSNNLPHHKESKDFKTPTGWHNLVVAQDRDQFREDDTYYEFQVDGVSLERVPIPLPQNTNIPFDSTAEAEFYIGGLKNGDEVVPLTGEISQLEFDPNDTCWIC